MDEIDIWRSAHLLIKQHGEGAGFRQPMAVAVIGGLISSTVLSLVLVPVIYSFVDGFERWLNPLAGKLATARTPDDDKLLKGGEI